MARKSKNKKEISMQRRYVELLEKMNAIYVENENRGLPIMGILLIPNTLDFACKPIANDRRISEENKAKTHPEYKMIKKMLKEKRGRKFDLFTTLSPCDKCYKYINKSKIINKVFYVIKNTWSDESKIDLNKSPVVKYKQLNIIRNYSQVKDLDWFKKFDENKNIIKKFVKHKNSTHNFKRRKLKLVYHSKSVTVSVKDK